MNPVSTAPPSGEMTPPNLPEASRPYVKQKVMDLPPELQPNIDHLVFEDGQPVESIFAERQMRLFVEPLYTSWPGPPSSGKFAAMANVGLFPANEQTRLVPDCLVSTDVEIHRDPFPREHRSYLVWTYGKPPDLVLELVSDRTGGELAHKLRDYARVAVGYYVVYDPGRFLSTEVLQAFERRGTSYVRMDATWFPAMELGVTLWSGLYQGVEATWLRWCDREGTLLPTGAERAQQAEERAQQAEERARQAEERATQATQEASRDRQEKEKLLAQLRALGVKPES